MTKRKTPRFPQKLLKKTTDEESIFTVSILSVSLFKEHRFEFLDLILDKDIDLKLFKVLILFVLSSTFSAVEFQGLSIKY